MADSSLELNDLFKELGDDSMDVFCRDYWGKKILCTTINDDNVLEILDDGFHSGDVLEILKECRKEDTNELFTPDEMEEMISDLENRKITLILPFCFCTPAIDLKYSFIKEMSDYGADVEVGVYVSQIGGSPAPWHLDNNHNITIQLYGKKDWHCIPGNRNTYRNKALSDHPKNYIDQQIPIPSTGFDSVKTFHLERGSVIYLPPGYWHSVSPVEGQSLSIDIRIGNVIHSKWICESIFAKLLKEFNSDADIQFFNVDDRIKEPGFSSSMEEQLQFITNNISSILKSCRLPRPLLPQGEYSDGIISGGSLDFLIESLDSKIEWKSNPTYIAINDIVSITLKYSGNSVIILNIISISPLTEAEYFRYNLYCPSYLENVVQKLIKHGHIDYTEELKLFSDKNSNSIDINQFSGLFKLLLFSHILHCEIPSTSRKRRKLVQ